MDPTRPVFSILCDGDERAIDVEWRLCSIDAELDASGTAVENGVHCRNQLAQIQVSPVAAGGGAP